MCQSGAKLCHLVHVVNTLASEEVQSVEVLLVLREEHVAVWLLNADYGLEDGALAFLNPLTHRVQVGGEVARSREDALSVLALALAVELLPPLAHEMELWLIVDHDLNLLSSLIETVAYGCILGCRILCVRNVLAASLLHVLCASHELLDVEACASYWQQTYRGEH